MQRMTNITTRRGGVACCSGMGCMKQTTVIIILNTSIRSPNQKFNQCQKARGCTKTTGTRALTSTHLIDIWLYNASAAVHGGPHLAERAARSYRAHKHHRRTSLRGRITSSRWWHTLQASEGRAAAGARRSTRREAKMIHRNLCNHRHCQRLRLVWSVAWQQMWNCLMPKHLTHSHPCRAFPRWQRWTKEERAGAPAAACSLRMCKSAANARVSRTSNIVHCPHGRTCKIFPTRTRALRRSMFLTRGSKLDHRRSQHLMRLRAMTFP